jgi:hypothetical protein
MATAKESAQQLLAQAPDLEAVIEREGARLDREREKRSFAGFPPPAPPRPSTDLAYW